MTARVATKKTRPAAKRSLPDEEYQAALAMGRLRTSPYRGVIGQTKEPDTYGPGPGTNDLVALVEDHELPLRDAMAILAYRERCAREEIERVEAEAVGRVRERVEQVVANWPVFLDLIGHIDSTRSKAVLASMSEESRQSVAAIVDQLRVASGTQ